MWEWTRSRWGGYPYPADEKDRMEREDLSVNDRRVLRGGSFRNLPGAVRCASRRQDYPDDRYHNVGFRVVVSPFSD